MSAIANNDAERIHHTLIGICRLPNGLDREVFDLLVAFVLTLNIFINTSRCIPPDVRIIMLCNRGTKLSTAVPLST